jgi:hypothetical protein
MSSCECGSTAIKKNKKNNKDEYIIGFQETKIGRIPNVSTKLTFGDTLGSWKARWGINRNNYKIEPGLYSAGNPDENSIVLVTANYKMTFDVLRKELEGLNAWIMVLDTKGINVWCAAGKGTFGTEELIERIISTKLLKLIKHSSIILPQLGAVGVNANIVRKNTGLKIIFGPVYAKDIKSFIANGFKKTEKMRGIHFNFLERSSVMPIELVQAWPFFLVCFALSLIFALVDFKFSIMQIMNYFISFAGAVIAGSVLFPLMLPLLPSKAFSLKGAILGAIWATGITIFFKFSFSLLAVNILLLAPISSFLAMNFTGATTYTSVTGAQLEVKVSLPIIIASIFIGLVLKGLLVFRII